MFNFHGKKIKLSENKNSQILYLDFTSTNALNHHWQNNLVFIFLLPVKHFFLNMLYTVQLYIWPGDLFWIIVWEQRAPACWWKDKWGYVIHRPRVQHLSLGGPTQIMRNNLLIMSHGLHDSLQDTMRFLTLSEPCNKEIENWYINELLLSAIGNFYSIKCLL